MAKVHVTCPKCLVQYSVDESHLGRTGHCKKCNTAFELTRGLDNATRTCFLPTGAEEHPPAGASGEQSLAIWNVGDVVLGVYEVKRIREDHEAGKHYAEGGMGLVYRVRHRGWDLDLALKSPKPETFQTERGKENFERECTTWIELGLHPNIVSCYYVRRVGGIPMVFAEFVEDGSLEDWISNRKLYQGGPAESLRRILDIAIQFAWGLEYAHGRGLIHQDVKPDNLMMDGGVPKVTDFGLAKARVAAGELAAGTLQRSMFVSWGGMTPAYCSPEQIEAALQIKSGIDDQQRTRLTRRTDVWSFGVSLLAMFFGKAPCSGGGHTAGKILRDYLDHPAESEILPRMPDTLADLLNRCFQHDPEDRPQSMREIAGVLADIYRQATGTSYSRQEPVTAELKANALNNRAVSLIDLGNREEAASLLEEAWELHPWQSEVAHNRGLLLWRAGQISDRDLVHHLEELCRTRPLDWEAAYSMGQVQLERGEVEAAVKALEQAVGLGGQFEVQATLDRARARLALAPRCVRALTELPPGGPAVYLSSDRHWVLVQVDPQGVRLLNALTGQRVIHFHLTGESLSGSLSSDRRWKLVADGSRVLRLWDLAKGRKVRSFRPLAWGPATGAVSADGRFELSATDDFSLEFKLRSSGETIGTFWGHTEAITSICLSGDGRWALSASLDRTIRLWRTETGCCLRTFKAHAGPVRSVYLDGDGRWALSTGADRTLRFWNLELLSDESRRFLSTTVLCHVTSSEEAGKAQAQFAKLCQKARQAAQAGDYGQALELIYQARALPGYEVGREVLDLWSLAGGHCRRKYLLDAWCVQTFEGHTKDVHAAALSTDGRRVVSGSWDNTVKVWAADTGQCTATLNDHTDSVRGVSLDATGNLALSASWDKTLRLWDLAAGECLGLLAGHGNCVTSVDLSADGSRAVSGSWDRSVRLWDVAQRRCLQSFDGHTAPVNAVALSPDGCLVLSGSEDKTIRLWEVAGGRCLHTLEGHDDRVTAVCFSSDGRWAMSASKDWTLKLWNIATGDCVRTFKGHHGAVHAVFLSFDGHWAFSGGKDKTVRLWEVATGSCVHAFEGHAGSVWAVALTPDCRWMLSAGEDWSLRLWELDWDYEFPGWADWHDDAQPFLEAFLMRQTPLGADGLTRSGPPRWDENDFTRLIRELQYGGFGWLRADGVRRRLTRMAGWAEDLPPPDNPHDDTG